MPKMRIAVVPKPGADFELQTRDLPEPPAGHVRIRVQACGICLSDHLVKDGLWPGVTYPRSQATKSQASSTKSAQASPLGRKASA
jgi:D-arabinose 1-dehydrogenase-like Zn-dependent alcohol dehydrogenase